MKTLKLLSLLLLFLLPACGGGSGDTVNPHYGQRMAYFAANPAPVGATMMIGDSITEQWTQERGFPISWVNRGIGGDNTAGVIARLPTHLSEQPAKVYLLIGINDCIAGHPSSVINNFPTILQIAASYPAVQFNVISILPAYAYGVSNATVEWMNDGIKAACQQYGVNYIDAYPSFANYSNPTSLYYDNLHPSDLGYSVLYPLL